MEDDNSPDGKGEERVRPLVRVYLHHNRSQREHDAHDKQTAHDPRKRAEPVLEVHIDEEESDTGDLREDREEVLELSFNEGRAVVKLLLKVVRSWRGVEL